VIVKAGFDEAGTGHEIATPAALTVSTVAEGAGVALIAAAARVIVVGVAKTSLY